MKPDEILYLLEELEMALNDCALEDREYFLERSEEICEQLNTAIETVQDLQHG